MVDKNEIITEITNLVSPDPKILITQSGGAISLTLKYNGLSGENPSWSYSTDDGHSWTTYSSQILVNHAANIVVNNAVTLTYAYANSFLASRGSTPTQLNMVNNTATFSSSTFTLNNSYHITLSNIATGAGGWVYDDNGTNHTISIAHGLGRPPNQCVVWFSPALSQPVQGLLSWSWSSSSSGNPVAIRADSDNVYLDISYGATLHGFWKPTSTTTGQWTYYSSGYWRIVAS